MHIEVKREPCLLYETVELLCAYVNEIPAEQLTAEGKYCLSEQEIEDLMRAACDGVNPAAPLMQQFFKRHNISGEIDRYTCLAACMVYFFMSFPTGGVSEQLKDLSENWERTRRKAYRVCGISRFTLEIEEKQEKEIVPLREELRKLPVSDKFYAILLETFSDFDYQLSILWNCICPVVERLEKLLRPYVERAMPLQQEWIEFFEQQPVEDFLKQRAGVVVERPLSRACFTLRYLDCRYAPAQLEYSQDAFWMHIGVGVRPVPPQVSKCSDLSERELAAFRLLGDKGRLSMIHALSQKRMSTRELTSYLNLNSGTIFRNLNSMSNAGLLIKEAEGDRYFYRTNMQFINTVMEHVQIYCNNHE